MMMKPTVNRRTKHGWSGTVAVLLVTALGMGALPVVPLPVRGVLLLVGLYACVAWSGLYLWASMRLCSITWRDLALPVCVLGLSSGGVFLLLESLSQDGAAALYVMVMTLIPLVVLFLLYEFVRFSCPPHNLRSGQWLLTVLPQPLCIMLLVQLRWIPGDLEVHLLLWLPLGAFLFAVAAWSAILCGSPRRRAGLTIALACGVTGGLSFYLLLEGFRNMLSNL